MKEQNPENIILINTVAKGIKAKRVHTPNAVTANGRCLVRDIINKFR